MGSLLSGDPGSLKTVLSDGVPKVEPTVLFGMILLGIAGSELGRRINKKIDNRQATLCLELAMVGIMAINLYNIFQFFE